MCQFGCNTFKRVKTPNSYPKGWSTPWGARWAHNREVYVKWRIRAVHSSNHEEWKRKRMEEMKRVSRFKLYSWGFSVSPFTSLHFAPKEREISLFLLGSQFISHPSSFHSTKPITSLTMILETIHSPLNAKPFISIISTPSSKFLSIPPSSIQSHTQMIIASLPPLPPLKLIQSSQFHFK